MAMTARDHPSVRQYAERCYDCSARGPCAHHAECASKWDASVAADIGIGWASFVWREMDIRRPWPAYEGRCAAVAVRLVAWLATSDERRLELGRICSWRAGITWEALAARLRDQPYRQPDCGGRLYALPRYEHVIVRFRPRASSMSKLGLALREPGAARGAQRRGPLQRPRQEHASAAAVEERRRRRS